jgi:hypothetical protein
MFLIIIILSVFLIVEKKEFKEKCASNRNSISNAENNDTKQLEYDCSFTQTWRVYDMLEDFVGHHPDMSYVILERFQTFIPYSHKIPSNLKSQLERGKYYEFTYHIKGKGFIDDIDDVVEKLIPEGNVETSQNKLIVTLRINETDKLGMDQLQEPICQGNTITND